MNPQQVESTSYRAYHHGNNSSIPPNTNEGTCIDDIQSEEGEEVHEPILVDPIPPETDQFGFIISGSHGDGNEDG
jgi:hypothetical protein